MLVNSIRANLQKINDMNAPLLITFLPTPLFNQNNPDFPVSICHFPIPNCQFIIPNCQFDIPNCQFDIPN